VGERSKIGTGVMLTTYVHLVPMYIPSCHGKVKFTLEQTMKAQWGSRDIVLLFL